jgi:hypothetical protein
VDDKFVGMSIECNRKSHGLSCFFFDGDIITYEITGWRTDGRLNVDDVEGSYDDIPSFKFRAVSRYDDASDSYRQVKMNNKDRVLGIDKRYYIDARLFLNGTQLQGGSRG